MCRINTPNAATYFMFSLASLSLAGLFLRFIPLAFVFGFGCIAFATEGIRALRRDRYSLAELRRVHEGAEREDFEDGVFCPQCAEMYSSRYLTCPNCHRPASHPDR
ncbi:MAG: hypothetical protein ACR2HJ_01950 [Fimbriimonadales bacterium]